MSELMQLTKKLAELFADDPSVPSVTMAWIEDKQMFYVSICRYHAKFGDQKQVIAKYMHADIAIAIAELNKAIGVA